MNKELELKWLKSRQAGVGSSDSPVLVLGQVYQRTPIDVYIDKKKSITQVEQSDNSAFRRGHTYEPLAAHLFQMQTGVKVFTPSTEEDRFGGFQRFIPGRPLLADFDGICEDGWLFEAKSPTQNRFEQIEAEGVDEFYQVQAHHLAGVAHYSETLPGVESKSQLGGIKGTRLVFYAPEEIRLHIVEIPFEKIVVDGILDCCEDWWTAYVEKNISPFEPFEKKVKLNKTDGKYKPVGAEWENAVAELLAAKASSELAQAAEKEKEDFLKSVIEEAKLEKVILPSGTKISYALQDGKSSFDVKALQATYPDINLEQFYRVGEPFKSFRVYEKKKEQKK